MGMVDDILDRLEIYVDKKVDSIKLLREYVLSGSNGEVQTYRFGETPDTDSEAYPRILSGIPLVADQEVITAKVGGRRIVLGPVQSAPITQLDFEVPVVGETYVYSSTASGADTSSTTNTTKATAVAARTTTISDLPNGTYRFKVAGDHLTAHSAGGAISHFVTVGASEGTAFNFNSDSGSTATLRCKVVTTFNGIVVSGPIDVALKYFCGVAGTAVSRNPCLDIIAIRTGD